LLIKRKDLEIFLQNLERIQKLDIRFEQYPTPSRVAANLLWIAGIENEDLFQKNILDLGSGSGILAIGAAFLGAKNVFGIEIDRNAIEVAKRNCEIVELSNICNWICSDVRSLQLRKIHTTIMNPPFGMRKEGFTRDRDFLQKAFEISKVIYSISSYNEKTRIFFNKYCKENGAEIDKVIKMDFDIPWSYDFHKKSKHIIQVDLYRILN